MNGGRRCGNPIVFRPVTLIGAAIQSHVLPVPLLLIIANYAFANASEGLGTAFDTCLETGRNEYTCDALFGCVRFDLWGMVESTKLE